MSVLLPIGEFSRMTYLTVKALRHYHDLGLLEPAQIDSSSGYRMYSTAQVPTALLISRFRDLDMPLDDVREMLHAPDLATRNQIILAHLDRMQDRLAKTQATVESLKVLLEVTEPIGVEFRWIDAVSCVSISATVRAEDCEAWIVDAYAEIVAVLSAAGVAAVASNGALYSDEFFAESIGDVVAFVPVSSDALDDFDALVAGRPSWRTLPAANFAVAMHAGSFDDIDRTYGALGAYVAEHHLGAAGPVREHYVVSSAFSASRQRTEVCWPIRPDHHG